MSARRVVCILGLAACAVPVAAQEARVVRTGTGSPGLTLANLRPESPQPFAREENLQARRFRGDESLSVEEARPVAHGCASVCGAAPLIPDVPVLAQVQVTAQHTPFLSEARIPLTQVWSGRLRLSAVQQRFHTANMYSVLSPAYAGEVGTAPGVQSIVGGSRVNYGLGVQLRFGR